MSQGAIDEVHLSKPSLRELAIFFLKLGTIAFGGPAAHVAMMQDELVRRKKWIASGDFLDLFAVANLLPGPSSTELAIFIGYRLGGLAGLLLAGGCFILPAFFMVAGLGWIYVRYGTRPEAGAILYGVKPVVIAIVLQALCRLGKSAIKTRELAVLAVLALVASFLGANPLAILLGAGVLALGMGGMRLRGSANLPLALGVPALPLAAGATAASIGLAPLFLVFLKIGCVVFGSGYVLLEFLQRDLVTQRGWISQAQLLDAVAIGQITPGPVFTTATFLGYLLAGMNGAIVATLGIFRPAFVFVAVTGPLVSRIRRSKLAAIVLDGLNVASLGLMASVTWQLAKAALVDPVTIALAILCAVALLVFRVNSVWAMAAGVGVGLATWLFRH